MKKILACALVGAAYSMAGCGGGGAAGTAPAAQSPPPAVVTGVDTPKSVSVVTAN